MSAYRRVILPSIILLIALFLRQDVIDLYGQYGQIFDLLPYLLMAASLLLSVFFNLSINFIATLFALIIFLVIQTKLQMTLDDFSALYAYTSICLVTPCVTLLLFLAPEKGLRNKHGLTYLGITLFFITLPVLLYFTLQEQTITGHINSYFPIRPTEAYIQSVNSSILFLVAAIVGFMRLKKVNEEYIAANIALLFSLFGILSFFQIEKISTVLFTANAIILIASALRSSHNLAYRDELTGLLGRRALNDRMKAMGKKYVIAMMDVDHFKKFNDTYGHDIGDEVLKMVARKLDEVKGGGTAYRYGGEEFCILFPGKTIDDAAPFLEVVRETIENYQMVVRNTESRPKTMEKAIERRSRRKQNRENKTVSVTISIGAAERNKTRLSPEETLKNADMALYEAKQNGRNCTMISRG